MRFVKIDLHTFFRHHIIFGFWLKRSYSVYDDEYFEIKWNWYPFDDGKPNAKPRPWHRCWKWNEF